MDEFEVTETVGTDGVKITDGKGAGMKPEVGKAAALESYDEIKQILLE